MRHPKDVGDRSTLAIMYALRLLDWVVLVPFGENTRYDLVVDTGTQLRRVQCKTGRLRKGAIVFPTCSTYAHHPNPKIRTKDYEGEIDDFAVFAPELGAVYLVPIEDMPTKTAGSLRVDRPKNNQNENVRFAGAYEIARIDVY